MCSQAHGFIALTKDRGSDNTDPFGNTRVQRHDEGPAHGHAGDYRAHLHQEMNPMKQGAELDRYLAQAPRHAFAGDYRCDGGGPMNHNFDDALLAQQNKIALRRGPALDSCPSFGRNAPRRPPNFSSSLGTFYPRATPKSGSRQSQSVPQLPLLRPPSGLGSPTRSLSTPLSTAEKRLPSTRAPSPYVPMNWSQAKRNAGCIPANGDVRFHVPAADYRKHMNHELKPMGMGDGQYMENRKLNKRHDRLAGDFRGQASGTGLMKQEMCPGHGTIWSLGDDGLWRYTKDENEKTWQLPASKSHHISGELHTYIATEKHANLQSPPSSQPKSHIVREGDYRAHVDYDKKHAGREDSASHVVKEGDYREHLDYDKKHGGGHVAV